MIDKIFQSILWEYDLNKLNYENDVVFVRTLIYGDLEHINILKNKLWKEKFKQKFLKNLNKLDKKTINYWCIIFDIDKKNLQNIQTQYEKLNKATFTRSFRQR